MNFIQDAGVPREQASDLDKETEGRWTRLLATALLDLGLLDTVLCVHLVPRCR